MKKQPDHINDELLVKYLLNITDPTERAAVAAWLVEKDEHQQYFEHFRIIWEESKKLAPQSTVDENDAWEHFKQRVGANENTTRILQLDSRPYSYQSFLRIAAVLLVLLVAAGGWFFYRLYAGRPMEIVSSGTQIKQGTLPDGSQIILNKQSAIEYVYSKHERKVKLEGEAFFNVAQDAGKPFVIKVNEVTVKVLGTSFNIKSSCDITEVVVETGAVEVTKNNNSIRLQSHEKAIVTVNQEAPSKESNTDELYNYYRTQTFTCNNTPLWKLVEILNEAYGVNIVIADNNKRNLPLNATFHNSSLDSTLKVIGLTYEITVEKKGAQIILK
ncbi:FecR family protein [Chitinophaga sp. 30R24]|uniref:FecR family protein n=1 Tax=Chitinophaga sp. 30R24 TaxID=3248838 RepID=UPI003B910FA0